jgi:hypothetical protein
MLGRAGKNPRRADAVARVQTWTRERFALPEGSAIMVAELACALPGCPPLETVVGFWVGERHHHFKVFKPLEAVARDDLPPSWLRDALAVPGGFECGCC